MGVFSPLELLKLFGENSLRPFSITEPLSRVSNLKLAYVALEPRSANLPALWCSISSLHFGFNANHCNRLKGFLPSGSQRKACGQKQKTAVRLLSI